MGEADAYNESGHSSAIGLLGGSFDPVHRGHVSIARSFVQSAHIDRLWVLLTPDPPHKTDRTLTGFSDRFEMLKRAFQSFSDIEISPVENELPRPTYTFQTIRHLKREYPHIRFYLCMGSDSLRSFYKWYRYERILEEVDLLVARRPGDELSTVAPGIINKTHIVDHEPVELSSTRIREALQRGEHPSDSIPREVMDYIQEKKLYEK